MSRSRHPVRLYVKPPPSDVCARYLLAWDAGEVFRAPDHFPHVCAPELFRRPGAMALDIGCATGEFAVGMARSDPDQCILGIDRAAKPLYRAIAAASGLGLDNVKFLKIDFRVLLPLLPPRSIAAAYYHFPSPYFKARHDRTGIFGLRFLDVMAAALGDGGYISTITDDKRTFDYFREVAGSCGRYRLQADEPYRLAVDERNRSFHHVKWELRGKRIYRLELYPLPDAGGPADGRRVPPDSGIAAGGTMGSRGDA